MERSLSNAVFSNGALDPWHGGGVTAFNDTARGVASIVIKDVGHHIDLMFSSPLDPPQVTAAREFERGMIRGWVDEANRARKAKRGL